MNLIMTFPPLVLYKNRTTTEPLPINPLHDNLDACRESVPSLWPALGQGLFATPLGLDIGGELQERVSETFAVVDLSVPVRGGDSQFETTEAELLE